MPAAAQRGWEGNGNLVKPGPDVKTLTQGLSGKLSGCFDSAWFMWGVLGSLTSSQPLYSRRGLAAAGPLFLPSALRAHSPHTKALVFPASYPGKEGAPISSSLVT